MPEQLEIILSVTGDDDAARAFTGVGKAASAADKSTKGVGKAAADATKSVEKLERAEENTNARRKKAADFALGPYQRMARLQEQLNKAQETGNKLAEKDIQLMIERQRRMIKRAEADPLEQQFVFRNSLARAGFAMAGAGPFATAGAQMFRGFLNDPSKVKTALFAAGLTAATVVLMHMTEAAAGVTRAFADLKFTTGGTTQQATQLDALGRAIGLGREQMGALSSRMQSAITGDPMARVMAMQSGVFNLPRPFGDINEAKNLLRMAKELRGMPEEAAIRTARQLGIEPLLKLRNVSPGMLDKLDKDAEFKGQFLGPERTSQAADFEAAAGRVAGAFENLALAVAKMPIIVSAMNALADIVNFIAKYANVILATAGGFIVGNLVAPGVGGPVGGLLAGGAAAFLSDDPDKVADQHGAKLDSNTMALERNTLALTGMRNVFGRGQRMEEALPIGFTGMALRQMMTQGGFSLSAY